MVLGRLYGEGVFRKCGLPYTPGGLAPLFAARARTPTGEPAASAAGGDGGHELLGVLVLDVGRTVDHAVARVVVHEAERHLVECSLDRRDLRQDLDAACRCRMTGSR